MKKAHKSNDEVRMELREQSHHNKIKNIIATKFKPSFDRTSGGIQESVSFIAMAAKIVEMSAKAYASKVLIKDLGVEVPIKKGELARIKFDDIFDECKDIPVSDFIEATNMFTQSLQYYILREGVKKESKEYDIDKIIKDKTA